MIEALLVVAVFIMVPVVYLAIGKVWPTDPQKASWVAAGIVFASTLHRAVTEPEAERTRWMIVVSAVLWCLLIGRFIQRRRA